MGVVTALCAHVSCKELTEALSFVGEACMGAETEGSSAERTAGAGPLEAGALKGLGCSLHGTWD